VRGVEAPGAAITHRDGTVYVSNIRPGTSVSITVRSKTGMTTRIVVLTDEQAKGMWKASVSGREHIFLSPADVFVANNHLHLRARDTRNLHVSVFPPLRLSSAGSLLKQKERNGVFLQYSVSVRPRTVAVEWRQTRKAAPSEPVRKGQYNALAPVDADFERAAIFRLQVPKDALTGLSDLFLRIRYTGDVARLYRDKRLLMDDFYNGRVWEIGIKRFASEVSRGPLEIKITPLRKDAPIYLPAKSWPEFSPSGEIANILEITAEPEYEAIVRLEPGK
jgi:hypothetical protein